jgi:large subunit ribosomal protein L31
MKKDLHPTYFVDSKITCACGNVIPTGSTKESIVVEVCSNCHPFYTGKQNILDTAGTVDRFKKRTERATALSATKAEKKPRKARTTRVTSIKK